MNKFVTVLGNTSYPFSVESYGIVLRMSKEEHETARKTPVQSITGVSASSSAFLKHE
jgi:hypothetical protein